MSTAFFSQSWYLVSELKPNLRSHAQIHRHIYREQLWYILQDDTNGQFHRFTPGAYQIIGMMDGKRPLQEIWEAACYQLQDDMPTQDEIIVLISKLFKANVLQSDVTPDIDELHKQRQEQERKKLIQQLKSPLGIRIPLLDPENFLKHSDYIAHIFYNKVSAFLWILIVALGLMLAGVHWEPLTSNLDDRILSLENVLLIALVYPFVKIIHELGHAYAVKRWGGEVHEMGVMLLVFFPVPYVDASAASAFQNKYQRMLVGAAGILVEVFIAATAMIVWVLVEPGLVRTLAFNTMTIAGVSTLLFNGNPLLRFDAYYVLADYLEIPNLAKRSNETVAYAVKRFAYGIDDLVVPFNSKSEATWMVVYSIAAFVYRLVIMVVISLFIASQYFLIGILLALWSIYMTLIGPLIKTLSKPFFDKQLRQKKRRVILVSSALLIPILLLISIVPLPYATKAEGVIWASEKSFIRAGASGFIQEVVAEPGALVKANEPLLTMREPNLDTRVNVLSAQLKEANARYQGALNDRVESAVNREIISFREKEYKRALERQGELKIYSDLDGTFIIPEALNLPGRYIHQGEMLGYVINYKELPAIVLVSEDFIDLVRNNTHEIEIRLASNKNISYKADIQRIIPASGYDLPSQVLSTEGGGVIALNPQSSDQALSFSKYFQLLLDIPDAPKNRLDERVYVLFKHASEPIMLRWYRGIRRVFLRQLDV